ncbi:MAG: hypothetical protein L6R37_005229 [Teloschistes peruensis]|nr:MAG: hypothetical protein L6R37_005229 [Teloschistes peruensis]
MTSSSDPDHFFQTSHSLAETERKSLKSTNKNGNPIRLPSKILAVVADPSNPYDAVFIAESVGSVRRVTLEVDFVKCLLTLKLSKTDLLVSGAADASIIVWDLQSAERLHVLKGHSRGILDLALDPATYHPEISILEDRQEAIIFSACSDREIRRWRISVEKAEQVEAEKPILVHDTSVYCLRFDADEDLWTASADGTTKCLSRSRGFQPDTTMQHGDYVRAVAVDEAGGFTITAGRSEDIKVWDRGSGDLVHVYEGHYEEVTGLLMLEHRCVSVGIDATVRVWSLTSEDLRAGRRKKEEDQHALLRGDGVRSESTTAGDQSVGGLTEEEAKELDELMQDD